MQGQRSDADEDQQSERAGRDDRCRRNEAIPSGIRYCHATMSESRSVVNVVKLSPGQHRRPKVGRLSSQAKYRDTVMEDFVSFLRSAPSKFQPSGGKSSILLKLKGLFYPKQ